jgi:hypothetical protein
VVEPLRSAPENPALRRLARPLGARFSGVPVRYIESGVRCHLHAV